MPERVAPGVAIRAYHRDDAAAIRDLAAPDIERTSYRSAPRATIDGLTQGTDPETRALVAVRNDAIVAFVIHGTVAGAEGAGRVQLIVTAAPFRRAGIARHLVEAAVEDLRDAGARFTMVEMPDDPALAPGLSLLGRCDFRIDARVRDFYRDGVDLLVFRRETARS